MDRTHIDTHTALAAGADTDLELHQFRFGVGLGRNPMPQIGVALEFANAPLSWHPCLVFGLWRWTLAIGWNWEGVSDG